VTRLLEVEFTPAPRRLAQSGLLGWARARQGLVVFDLVVRRTARGHLEVVFPTRRDARGRERALVRPIDPAAREAIRLQVLAAAGLEGAS